jgi:hypothetical protein
MKPNFQLNIILINELRKKSQLQKRKKNKSLRLIRDSGYETGIT